MKPTVAEPEAAVKTPAEFYDNLSASYDAMTNYDKRFVRERPFFAMLVEQHKIRTAIDAGCGTGFHSILLGQLGVSVTAADVSTRMLKRAEENALIAELKIDLVESSIQDLPDRVHRTYDAVVCLGNTLPHIPTQTDLARSLKSFFALLNPGGVLLLQQLNFDRILAKKERLQSLTESGGRTYIRFYEFQRSAVVFKILTIDAGSEGSGRTMESVLLHPLRRDELVHALGRAGFHRIRTHGSIAFDDFNPASSKDLVVLAQKPEL
ncbi:MAG TPA: class I SAM-dependent methyltransferase [Bacteroidota bacterium]|nr:class I SAM-dependent methyltransferase [Bacteroidota bacterium]